MRPLCENTRSTGADVAGQQSTRLNSFKRKLNFGKFAKAVSESSESPEFIRWRYSLNCRSGLSVSESTPMATMCKIKHMKSGC